MTFESALFQLSLRTNKKITKTKTMGRGDKRTAKGKRFKGSYGISRPQKDTKSAAVKTAAPAAAKKAAAHDAAPKKTAEPKKTAAPKKAAAKKKAE